MSETSDPFIAALLREREFYAVHGKSERVAAVDAELKRLGHKPDTAPRSVGKSAQQTRETKKR